MNSISQQKFDSIFQDVEQYGQPGKEEMKFFKEQGCLQPLVKGKRSWVVRFIKGFLKFFKCVFTFQLKKLFVDINKDFSIALKVLKFLETYPDLLKGKNLTKVETALNNRIKKPDSQEAISLKIQYLQKLANSFQNAMNNHPQPQPPQLQPQTQLLPQPLPQQPQSQNNLSPVPPELFINPINMTVDAQMENEFQIKFGAFHLDGETNVVPVLNQKYEGDLGKEKCGAHALKNALVGIGLLVSSEISASWFDDEKVFEDLQTFIYDANGISEIDRKKPNTADTSIAKIQVAIDALAKCDVATLKSKYLIEFHHVCKKCPHMFSSFNMYNNQFFSAGVLALNSISYFYEVSTQQGPLIHAFMMGDPSIGPGHWITIIMKKEKDKPATFYGCNSWHNQQKIIDDIIKNLNNAMKDPIQAIEHMYNDQIAPGIKNSVLSFNDDGTLKYEDPKIGKKMTIQPLHISNALDAFDFMKKMKWLNKQTLQQKSYLNDHVSLLASFAHCMAISKEPHNCKINDEQRLKFIEMEKILNGFVEKSSQSC